ncbi:hypothetical protein PAXRUDRAFT_151725 [Paxillus rubicundulus Ve08.2h10]|uniref:Unplaced genomic scaffold scaffold_684, whole genome shotgun sequence n=1 Tax=Paxillus rubicundulus Ve08.2h10 TaxID=930991 RepID=A0A0D0DRQ8_9AGAM|nr:hypothetical protein PAXRUDRAFT_151725 [Paxillus rubicundulus Ve08.2h10]
MSGLHAIRAFHFYGSLKGHFQSLCEICFQIQNKDELEYASSWVNSCLILHNIIIQSEEELGLSTSMGEFTKWYKRIQEERAHEPQDLDGDRNVDEQ